MLIIENNIVNILNLITYKKLKLKTLLFNLK